MGVGWALMISSCCPTLSLQQLPAQFDVARCTQVYIDIGLNVGDMLLALYAPEGIKTKPEQKQARAFSALFGSNRSSTCSIGFEPNPMHQRRLAGLAARLRARGHHVQIFGYGVSNETGSSTYWTDTAPHNIQNNGWGSSLLRWAANMDEGHAATVPTVTLQAILTRLPAFAASTRPQIGMKLDCEGCEYDALPPALYQLCANIDVLWLERHDRFFSRKWRGHKAGFESNGRVEALDESLRDLGKRRAASTCRTAVKGLSTFERAGRRLALSGSS